MIDTNLYTVNQINSRHISYGVNTGSQETKQKIPCVSQQNVAHVLRPSKCKFELNVKGCNFTCTLCHSCHMQHDVSLVAPHVSGKFLQPPHAATTTILSPVAAQATSTGGVLLWWGEQSRARDGEEAANGGGPAANSGGSSGRWGDNDRGGDGGEAEAGATRRDARPHRLSWRASSSPHRTRPPGRRAAFESVGAVATPHDGSRASGAGRSGRGGDHGSAFVAHRREEEPSRAELA
jgi:hypothetical protein